MRVLMIVFNQVGKGTYWRAYHLGRCLVERGHEVWLMAVSPAARLRTRAYIRSGLHVVETPELLPGALRSGWDGWDALRRVAWVNKQRFDVVHAFEARPVVLLPALAARRHGAALVMDWCDWFGRGGSVEERPNPALRALLRPVETFFEESFRHRADGTTVINSVLCRKAQSLGVPPASILLLPNGANLDGITPRARPAARERLDLPQDVFIIAYTGAIFRRDAALLAETFRQVHAARPDARLLIIGYSSLTAEQLGAAPGTFWRTGPVAEAQLAEYLAASDLGLLPLCDTGANRGRMPMKLTDFMAAGLPVVATDVADLGELLRGAPIGALAQDNPAALASAVLRLAADAEERERCGSRARQVAEQRFAWPALAAQAEGLYRAAVQRRGLVGPNEAGR